MNKDRQRHLNLDPKLRKIKIILPCSMCLRKLKILVMPPRGSIKVGRSWLRSGRYSIWKKRVFWGGIGSRISEKNKEIVFFMPLPLSKVWGLKEPTPSTFPLNTNKTTKSKEWSEVFTKCNKIEQKMLSIFCWNSRKINLYSAFQTQLTQVEIKSKVVVSWRSIVTVK